MREIKFTGELPEKDNPNWKGQYYVETLKPNYKQNGYVMRKVKNHPFSNKRGYVPEHRLLFEERLGRFLIPRKELVHHIDGDRSNNSISNLKLTSPSEHPKGHVGERNHVGQFVANEPIFQELKFKLLNTNTMELRPYTLSELIGKTYRKGQFLFRGRYTGLKDKNGVEIYEGDVVSYSEHYIGDHRYSSGKGVIKFDNGGFYISESELSPELCREEIENEHIEIIGNIYEDSELVDK